MVLPNEQRLRAENWRDHPQILSRLGALQSLENQLAAQENRLAVPVGAMPPGKSGLGYFDPAKGENGAIYINSDLLMNDEPYQAVNTYFHEARHAYQHDVANHPDNHPEVEPSEVALWKRNEEAYLSTEEKAPGTNQSLYEYGHYYGQPIEVDARAEAANKTEQLYANQFQDQQGYERFKAHQNVRDEINEDGAQLIGDDYEEQARATMEEKYKSLHPELVQGQDEAKVIAGQATSAQPNGQSPPEDSQTSEVVEETREAAVEAAAPEFGAAKTAVSTEESIGESANESAEQITAQSATEPVSPGEDKEGHSDDESYYYGYGQ